MQTFILSFILLLIGCGSSSTESVTPCIIGSFGSNKAEYIYSQEEIKGVSIEDLERKLTFKNDGTGSFYRPAFKQYGRAFGQWEAFFNYKTSGNTINIYVTKLIIDGLDVEKDIEKGTMATYLHNLGIFEGIEDKISYDCAGTNIILNKAYSIRVVGNINGNIQMKNDSEVKPEQWVKRN